MSLLCTVFALATVPLSAEELAPGSRVTTARPLGSHVAFADKHGVRLNTFADGFSVELLEGTPVEAFTCCDLQLKFELSKTPTFFYARGFGGIRAPFLVFRDGETIRFDLNGGSLDSELAATNVKVGEHGVYVWSSGPNTAKTRCIGIVKMDGRGWSYYARAAAAFLRTHPNVRLIIAGVSGDKKNRRLEYGLGAAGGDTLFQRVEKVVTEDAPALIHKECASGKLTLGLSGESMGGSFALSVGARNPGLFHYVGAASPTWLKSLSLVEPVSASRRTSLLISYGEYEGKKQQDAVQTFKGQATEHYTEVIERTFLGGHGFAAWGSAFEALLVLMHDAT